MTHSSIHRKGCTCDKICDIPWTCAICQQKRESCWGGYTTEDHRDICSVCGFHAIESLRLVKVTRIADPSRTLTSRTAMLQAAAENVDFRPLSASCTLDRGTPIWLVTSLDERFFVARDNGRHACRDGHLGPWTAGKRRCCSCGEAVPLGT
jgi:hypothetical protein